MRVLLNRSAHEKAIVDGVIDDITSGAGGIIEDITSFAVSLGGAFTSGGGELLTAVTCTSTFSCLPKRL